MGVNGSGMAEQFFKMIEDAIARRGERQVRSSYSLKERESAE